MFQVDRGELDNGFVQVSKDLKRLASNYGRAYAAAVYLFGTEIATRAMRNVPVDSGYLRNSRYVTMPSTTDLGSFQFEVGFSAPYAAFVHERNLKYVMGGWKYLSRAVDELSPSASNFIERYTELYAKRGQGITDVPHVHPIGRLIGPHPRRKRSRKSLTERRRIRDEHQKKRAAKAAERAANRGKK